MLLLVGLAKKSGQQSLLSDSSCIRPGIVARCHAAATRLWLLKVGQAKEEAAVVGHESRRKRFQVEDGLVAACNPMLVEGGVADESRPEFVVHALAELLRKRANDARRLDAVCQQLVKLLAHREQPRRALLLDDEVGDLRHE